MQKNMLLKTSLLVCFIIITGFTVVALIDYKTSSIVFKDNIEEISALTSDGIYSRLESILAKPVNTSLAMAESPLLKSVLKDEPDDMMDDYTDVIQTYLMAHKEKYGYDSVFLVSDKTGYYYNFEGIDRVLDEDNAENDWYYSFLMSGEDYSLNVDIDQAAGNVITVFVNCRIEDQGGATLGVVGVGMEFNGLQSLLSEYANNYNANIYLINKNGDIEVAIDNSGLEPVNFFATCSYPQFKDEILGNRERTLAWWITEDDQRNYVFVRYIKELNWHLIVQHNTASQDAQITFQLLTVVIAVAVIVLLVMTAITFTIRSYNRQIVTLTAAIEHERHAAFREATEQLYDNIYELNITENYAMSDHTKCYFESLGIAGDTPYDEALAIIAQETVQEEYREGYVSTFCPENVCREFAKGNTILQYDLLADSGENENYWLRIMAHIYYRKEDDSICMFTYRKNIDSEKRKEARLSEQAQLDGLTRVYNKTVTERQIEQMLDTSKDDYFAFFIIDIDNFKQINDNYGHIIGDHVITQFARIIKSCFRDGDVIGRIGGDEFVAFIPIPDEDWAYKKAAELSRALDTDVIAQNTQYAISASIGVATTIKSGSDFKALYKNADATLYETKRGGKNGFSLYGYSGKLQKGRKEDGA